VREVVLLFSGCCDVGWKGGELVVTIGDIVGGKEGIGATVEHCHGELVHHWFCLEVQILQYGIAEPSTKHVDVVVVDSAVHENHGVTRAQIPGAGVPVPGGCLLHHGNGGHTKSFSDVLGFDGNSSSIVIVRGEWSGFHGFVLTKVEDAMDGGFDRACKIIRADVMGDDFNFCAIFLHCEGE
jgi:hypothetical protein